VIDLPKLSNVGDPQRVRSESMDVGRLAIATEIRGLERLATSIDAAFAHAVDILAAVTGRVVVTGMGKSGHVGCKIAATFASTGTPAFFVHPGEASHGDLGMIARNDAVVAISNSGETAELADIVAYTRRFQIPLIALTSGADSTLSTNSDVALVLPAAPEACPHGLAPTTSTTMTLALGDALAVALLDRKGFSASDFRQFHPGGKLGQRLIKVRDLMHLGDELPLCSRQTSMGDALVVMTSRRFGCVGVQAETGQLVGVITDGDLRRHMGPGLLSQSVTEVMTSDPVTTTGDTLAAAALELMNRRAITALFVLDEQRPVGILHIHDLLRAGVV
jgi:arabinose-5-phosphate isomerase